MITHHLDDTSIISLSSGTLNARLALAAIAHIEMCPKCRAGWRLAEHIGGALLVDQLAGPIEPAGLAGCWNLIERTDRSTPREMVPRR